MVSEESKNGTEAPAEPKSKVDAPQPESKPEAKPEPPKPEPPKPEPPKAEEPAPDTKRKKRRVGHRKTAVDKEVAGSTSASPNSPNFKRWPLG